MLIPKDAKPNTFGGWKFNVMMDGYQITIDVWPGDLGWLMCTTCPRWPGISLRCPFVKVEAE